MSDGLHTVRDGALEKLVAERNCNAPLVDGDDLYFVFEDEDESWAPTIACYDAKEGDVRRIASRRRPAAGRGGNRGGKSAAPVTAPLSAARDARRKVWR